ncbi:MAG: PilT/PilU family type 4a pilus ATPase [Candidatus Gracilibacteria bacterium]|nr:PilT/PilU family type 4a pilus ATPase [Candidatus Gracilibacteria bacterium]
MSNTTILESILNYSIQKKASDIHISEGKYITYRIKKKLSIMESAGSIDENKIKNVLLELMNKNEERVKEFMGKKDADFAYIGKDGTSFRVNAFFRLGKISFVLRRIESEPIGIEKLGLPDGVQDFITAKQGLILITGPTGSGKSTTMISILNEINKQRGEHILTIEDPVEFVFKDDKSIFSQREIGNDTNGFSSALRAAMREDPDIIMVGEMRDRETVEAAMELAETGHLVISTMHTSGSVATITRLINFFPTDIQNSVRYKLGDVLSGVLSQRLVQKADGSGIIGIFELMHMTTAIKSLIREGQLNQISQNIEMGRKDGMILMSAYAENLEAEGIIEKKEYENFFSDDI